MIKGLEWFADNTGIILGGLLVFAVIIGIIRRIVLKIKYGKADDCGSPVVTPMPHHQATGAMPTSGTYVKRDFGFDEEQEKTVAECETRLKNSDPSGENSQK
ncbi:MAG: hypothetical protein Q4A40_06165 [Bacillota bacterium]|nr:hypothetical protein [Bacillota bacterium]